MAVIQRHENRNGACPKCGWGLSRDALERATGEITDGVLFLTCTNCQEEMHVEVTLVIEEKL